METRNTYNSQGDEITVVSVLDDYEEWPDADDPTEEDEMSDLNLLEVRGENMERG